MFKMFTSSSILISYLVLEERLRVGSSHVEVLGFLGVFALSFFLFVMVAFQRLNAVMTEWCQKLPLYRLSVALIRSTSALRKKGFT